MSKEFDYIDSDSLFARKIESDGNICKSCYRKLRDFLEPARQMPDVVDRKPEYGSDAYFAYFDDYIDTGRPSRKKSYCKCGAVDWNDVKVRPLDEEQMVEVAKRVSDRLSEKDIDHDRSVLVSVVSDKCVRPKYQDREEKVLEEAVDSATTAVQNEKRHKVKD